MTEDHRLADPYMHCESIRTARLTLRPLTTEDLDRYAEYHGREDVSRYILSLPLSREESAKELARWIAADRLERSGDMIFFGVQLGDDSKLIGEVPVKLSSVEHKCAEIGWIFHPEVAGNGYATEAAQALLELAFQRLGMRRVVAYLDARNVASANVCRRLGMRQEAHFVENLYNLGDWKSTLVFALLESEWRNFTH
jgi:RimJ/RimL family protein N-acetyltransferase